MTAALSNCLYKASQRANGELNRAYNDVETRLNAAGRERLIRTQRLWLRYRESNCAAERELYVPGTAAQPVYLACLESMTRARIKDLQITYAVRLK
jgi:uncharacterized protein YecT (DUF1311 family)